MAGSHVKDDSNGPVIRPDAELEPALEWVMASPASEGVLEKIVRRPAKDEREDLGSGILDRVEGLAGDRWVNDGADPERQITLMNSRLVDLLSGGDRDRWAAAGDQLYVDLNLSEENLMPRVRLQVGDAVLELTAAPHLGCGKFRHRYGADAVRLVNSAVGRRLGLRGRNARVLVGGEIRVGDLVRKLGPSAGDGSEEGEGRARTPT